MAILTKEPLLEVVASALRSGSIEVTLQGLLDSVDAGGSPLSAVPAILDTLQSFSLKLSPSIEVGDLATIRVLRRLPSEGEDTQALAGEIASGESARVEFKESLCHDHRRARSQVGASISELRSEQVLEASLKTICGFLNAEGGVLIVGVADNGESSGIEDDFAHTGGGDNWRAQVDRWELHLRSVVRGRFSHGEVINNYIRVSFHDVDHRTLARIEVRPRSRLSCVKLGNRGHCAFLRRGNRTDQLEPWEIEELVLYRSDPARMSG